MRLTLVSVLLLAALGCGAPPPPDLGTPPPPAAPTGFHDAGAAATPTSPALFGTDGAQFWGAWGLHAGDAALSFWLNGAGELRLQGRALSYFTHLGTTAVTMGKLPASCAPAHDVEVPVMLEVLPSGATITELQPGVAAVRHSGQVDLYAPAEKADVIAVAFSATVNLSPPLAP